MTRIDQDHFVDPTWKPSTTVDRWSNGWDLNRVVCTPLTVVDRRVDGLVRGVGPSLTTVDAALTTRLTGGPSGGDRRVHRTTYTYEVQTGHVSTKVTRWKEHVSSTVHGGGAWDQSEHETLALECVSTEKRKSVSWHPMGRDRAKKKGSSSGARSKTLIVGDPSLVDALLKRELELEERKRLSSKENWKRTEDCTT
ncbi:hypothetical protein Tco_0978158 [Tanacetum coccineum]|uniref:Uncharacterized protein n=1 Tax=Tanacetum coccineum TaxID=301880 RepID=A0ABQ5EM64_9ASTR